MSLECSECERDLRAGHDENCSRYKPHCMCQAELCEGECNGVPVERGFCEACIEGCNQ